MKRQGEKEGNQSVVEMQTPKETLFTVRSTGLCLMPTGARRKIWRPQCPSNICHSSSKDHNIPFRALACRLPRLHARSHHRWPSPRPRPSPRLHCPTGVDGGAEGAGGAAEGSLDCCQPPGWWGASQNCLFWPCWESARSRFLDKKNAYSQLN